MTQALVRLWSTNRHQKRRLAYPRLSSIWNTTPIPALQPTLRRWKKVEPWLFYLAVLLMLVPLWSVHYFPSQDGPLHSYNAVVFRDYNRPDRPLFREFFQRNTAIVPNWVCPHLLPVLVKWMAPPLADKLVLTVYLLLFPLSIRYCLKGIRRDAAPLAIAALPFVPNQFYHMGFQDFCLSLAGFFITLGFYLRRRRHFTYWNAAMLATLLLATYVTHLLSAMMVLPLIGLIALFRAWSIRSTAKLILKELAPVVASMVPVTLVTLYFLLQHHPTETMFAYPKGWTHRFYFLISWMKGLGWLDLVPASVELLLFVVVSYQLLRQMRKTHSWKWLFTGISGACFLITCIYFTAFLVASDYAAGGQLILVRLAAYPMFTILLWWAAMPLAPEAFRRLQFSLAVVALPTLLVMLGLDAWNYSDVNQYLGEFEAIAPLVAPNSTLLPVHFENYIAVEPGNPYERIAVGVDPFRHAASFGLGERGVVNLSNFWASTDHQSLRWRSGLDPLQGGLENCVNFAAYTRRTGVPIDYLVIWTGGLSHDDLEGRYIKAQLKDYQLIYRSPQSGYLELYRKLENPVASAVSIR